jgi:2-(1,2-epoxy-1,2-dihydrophenyl)acetyl-CoA isomerase
MVFTTIRTAISDGVMTIALSRPERLNAFTSVMHAELREALSAAESDASVRCLVLTGEGRAFSAGQDLTEDRLVGATERSIPAPGSSVTTIRWSNASICFPR